jgi:hypothetical protein
VALSTYLINTAGPSIYLFSWQEIGVNNAGGHSGRARGGASTLTQ